jgi:uncharacterized membrane protein YjgN (DUF898 family)
MAPRRGDDQQWTMLQAEPAPPTPREAEPLRSDRHAFSFHGSGAAFFALVFKNMLLTLLSFGIYLPWAKTERRKYLLQNVEIAGHRLRYHGTGRELLVGYAKVVIGYLVFFGFPALLGKVAGSGASVTAQVVLGLALVALIPYAVWGSQAYLLSRTSYRGARFRLQGDFRAFVRVLVGGYFLTLLTLGFYAPVWTHRMYRELTNGSALGSRHFEYRGEDRVAFWLAMKGLGLGLLTFGIYLFWYQAALQRYRFANTHFDGAHGVLEVTGGELFQLFLLQVFALTFSFGLAFPWVTVYTLRFYLARTRFEGSIDFARIYGSDARGDAAADGLADVFDVGIAL